MLEKHEDDVDDDLVGVSNVSIIIDNEFLNDYR